MKPFGIVRPLPLLLHRVADELGDLAGLAGDLESLISRLAADSAPVDARLLADAQIADLLTQRLGGAATFVRALAQAAPDAGVDALAAVVDLTLTDQARRLGEFAPAPTCAAEGDMELFSI